MLVFILSIILFFAVIKFAKNQMRKGTLGGIFAIVLLIALFKFIL